MLRVTIWNEGIHEKTDAAVAGVYPRGIHQAIASFLACDDISVTTVTLESEECGLTQAVLDSTDVLLWWGHLAHDRVPDEIAWRVVDQVQRGMGFLALHSAHMSKPFRFLLGTSGTLSWREDGDLERIWTVAPAHPIAKGLGRYFELPHEETYCEPFGIPQPDELVFLGWYEGGEVFRAGCTFHRDLGKIFYFQPGHETFPTFYNPNVQTILRNAVRWAAPQLRLDSLDCPHITPPCSAQAGKDESL